MAPPNEAAPKPEAKFTMAEGLSDVPAATRLFESIKAAINGLPPKEERNAEVYVRALSGATEGSPLLLAAQLLDTIEKQAAD